MEKKSLSFFMPVYNEEENIKQAISASLNTLKKINNDYELIIVDDGSTDATRSIIQKAAKRNSHIKLVAHSHNQGYGSALRTGIYAATKKYTFYTDGDLQFDISQLPKLFQDIKTNQIIIGYRTDRKDSYQRLLMSSVYKLLTGIIFNIWVKDVNCSFKLFPTQLYRRNLLNSKTVFIDAEMMIRAHKAKYTFKEIPIVHFKRKSGKSKFEMGKKGIFMVINPKKVAEIIREIIQLAPSL